MQGGYGCVFFHSSNFLSLNFHWGLPRINTRTTASGCFWSQMLQKLCFSWRITITCHVSKTSFFFFFFGFCKYKFGNDLSKSWETFSQIRIQEFDNIRLFVPSLLQKFFKTKTTTEPFHHSPAYAKYREREKLVLPSSLSLSPMKRG